MEYVIIALKVLVAISLLNVWLVQKNKPTRWRGGDAKTITEEFEVYGLPAWMCYAVGVLKVGLGLALISSIWIDGIEDYAALGLMLLLLGSILMHVKIGDSLIKSFPAFLFFLCNAIIYWF